jgi:hypothetical protein
LEEKVKALAWLLAVITAEVCAFLLVGLCLYWLAVFLMI